MKHLILGGVKSGKSRYAEQLADDWKTDHDGEVIYIATARHYDDEFGERIRHHQARRPADWQTIEAPLDIAAIIERYSGHNACLLLECLTLWLSNVLCDELALAPRTDALCQAIENYQGTLLMVGNETGLGIMPDNALARQFGDQAGLLQQRIAALSDEVVLCVAGLPLTVKDAHV